MRPAGLASAALDQGEGGAPSAFPVAAELPHRVQGQERRCPGGRSTTRRGCGPRLLPCGRTRPRPPEVLSPELCALSSPVSLRGAALLSRPIKRRLCRAVAAGGPRCEPHLRTASPGRALGFPGSSPERPEILSGLELPKAGKPRVGPGPGPRLQPRDHEAAAGCSVRAGTRGVLFQASGPRLPRAPALRTAPPTRRSRGSGTRFLRTEQKSFISGEGGVLSLRLPARRPRTPAGHVPSGRAVLLFLQRKDSDKPLCCPRSQGPRCAHALTPRPERRSPRVRTLRFQSDVLHPVTLPALADPILQPLPLALPGALDVPPSPERRRPRSPAPGPLGPRLVGSAEGSRPL